jgi:anti-sigma B factor antagonist
MPGPETDGNEPDPGNDFRVEHRLDGDRAEVIVVGELDIYRAPELRSVLFEVLGAGARRVTVDRAGVSFLDSTGLGVLVSALKKLRQDGGELEIRRPTPTTRKVLEITGLTRIATVT